MKRSWLLNVTQISTKYTSSIISLKDLISKINFMLFLSKFLWLSRTSTVSTSSVHKPVHSLNCVYVNLKITNLNYTALWHIVGLGQHACCVNWGHISMISMDLGFACKYARCFGGKYSLRGYEMVNNVFRSLVACEAYQLYSCIVPQTQVNAKLWLLGSILIKQINNYFKLHM